MNAHARNIAQSVESVSKALAEWAVSAQFDTDPTLGQRYGDGARRRWVTDTQARISHLAQSVAVRSPELFVDSVRWMRAAHQARGLDATDLRVNLTSLRDVLAAEMPPAVTEVALPAIELAIAEFQQPMPAHTDMPAVGAASVGQSGPYLDAVLSGQSALAQDIALNAVDSGMTVPEIYVRMLHPAMQEIGRRWQMDEISVADEHFATAVTQTVMSRLRAFFPETPRRGRRMIATSVTGDLHEIGVRMVADFFEMDGWDAIYLGANMPATDMLMALIERDVHLVALSASSVAHMVAMGDAIHAIRTTTGCDRMKVLVGGPPFSLVPRLWKEVGADGYANSASEAVDVGNQLVNGDAVRS